MLRFASNFILIFFIVFLINSCGQTQSRNMIIDNTENYNEVSESIDRELNEVRLPNLSDTDESNENNSDYDEIEKYKGFLKRKNRNLLIDGENIIDQREAISIEDYKWKNIWKYMRTSSWYASTNYFARNMCKLFREYDDCRLFCRLESFYFVELMKKKIYGMTGSFSEKRRTNRIKLRLKDSVKPSGHIGSRGKVIDEMNSECTQWFCCYCGGVIISYFCYFFGVKFVLEYFVCNHCVACACCCICYCDSFRQGNYPSHWKGNFSKDYLYSEEFQNEGDEALI